MTSAALGVTSAARGWRRPSGGAAAGGAPARASSSAASSSRPCSRSFAAAVLMASRARGSSALTVSPATITWVGAAKTKAPALPSPGPALAGAPLLRAAGQDLVDEALGLLQRLALLWVLRVHGDVTASSP